MSTEFLTILLFSSLLFLLALGVPIAFALGGIGIIFSYFLWGPGALLTVSSIAFDKMFNYFLLAVPLFLFMAYALERSGVAEDL